MTCCVVVGCLVCEAPINLLTVCCCPPVCCLCAACCCCCCQILFATDIPAEAEAAAAAGWRAVLVTRPGNKPLPEEPGFRVIESMQHLLTPPAH